MKALLIALFACAFLVGCASGGSKKSGKNYSCSSSSKKFMMKCS